MAFHVCCGITDILHLNISLVITYVVGDCNSCAQPLAQSSQQTSSPSCVALMSAFPWEPLLWTLAVCQCVFTLALPSIQSCDSAPHHHSTTATFFSSCWSPSGLAPRRTGRRLPVHGSPSPSRHTGTTPCFSYESRIQLCPLPLVLPPPGSLEKGREERRGRE